ncbi:beta-N-acetylglucosaminidase [Bacteroidia bacterium]|nr:beta-N-acetylglucosaminidase [Bacteroidia bacterium]
MLPLVSPAVGYEAYLETLNGRNEWTEAQLSRMTVREKIAQLMMVAVYSNKNKKNEQTVTRLINNYKVGGIIFFQGNLVTQAKLTNRYQSLSTIPLLIAMDAEWGIGMRLDSVDNLPFQLVVGATRNAQYSYRMGSEIAKQFQCLGMHINFAPVADLNNNPANPVINVRSFGEEKKMVTNYLVAFMQGLQDNGVLACAKHFPGHGNTNIDSHIEIPTVYQTRFAIEQNELYPFKELINKNIACMMMGHLRVPVLDKSFEIASLSPRITTELLQKKMGFRGLIFTDGMPMKAVSQRYNAPAANLRALIAGNDVLVDPLDVPASIDTIEDAVKRGVFSMELLDHHCRKVLNTKYYFGLHKGAPKVPETGLAKCINSQLVESVKNQIIEGSLILATDKQRLVPIKSTINEKIAYIEIGNNPKNTFYQTAQQYVNIHKFSITQFQPDTYLHLLDSLSAYSLVIVGYMDIQQRRPQRNYGMDSEVCSFLLRVAQLCPTIVTLYASPYTASQLMYPNLFAGLLIAHNVETDYQKAAADALFGTIPILGRCPVTVPNVFVLEQGIQRKRILRLKNGTPQELGIKTDRLKKVDEMIAAAIKEHAFPGCQVLAAHKGVAFYNKSFGYHTYNNDRPVTSSDLYDIASLTKVVGTLPMIMKMYEQKELELDEPIEKYIALPEKSNKNSLQVRDLLMHQAGLQAWLPLITKFLIATPNSSLPALDGNFFATQFSPEYPLPIADNIWAKKSIQQRIYQVIDSSELSYTKTLFKKNVPYLYSDLGFYYLQRIAEQNKNSTIAQQVDSLFFRPLGMQHTTYLPLQKFGKRNIVPTELEEPFRRQLIHGYVHDQGAALMGGVAGHAGLFATANDLAKYLQMLLWLGNYGGMQFLKPATVELFTKYQSSDSRRALGFDKPEPNPKKASPICPEASPSSYGHTGFTGTMVWVDPEREMLFVFLSNRVHPSASNNLITTSNIRSNILSEFLKAIDEKQK